MGASCSELSECKGVFNGCSSCPQMLQQACDSIGTSSNSGSIWKGELTFLPVAAAFSGQTHTVYSAAVTQVAEQHAYDQHNRICPRSTGIASTNTEMLKANCIADQSSQQNNCNAQVRQGKCKIRSKQVCTASQHNRLRLWS